MSHEVRRVLDDELVVATCDGRELESLVSIYEDTAKTCEWCGKRLVMRMRVEIVELP